MSSPWPLPSWLGTALVLAVGVCVIVGGAAMCARLTRAAAWRRAFWRGAIAGILLLLAAEATGVSIGIVQWWRVNGALPQPALAVIAEPSDRPASLDYLRAPDAGWEASAARDLVDDGSPSRRIDRVEPAFAERGVHDRVRGVADGASEFGKLSGGFSGEMGESRGAEAASRAASGSRSSGDWFRLVWFLGVAVLAARMLWARWVLRRFRRRQRRLDSRAVRRRVDRLAARLGLGRRVDILVSPQLAAPVAFGYLRPAIVIPARFLDDFDPRQQDAMLAHEAAHLAAGDPAWQLWADLAAALLWWHPLVWWVRRQARTASELAADEACLLVPHGAETLAACLVVLARRLESRPRLACPAMAGLGLRSALGCRVERLLNLPARTWRTPARRRLRMVTTTVSVAFVLVAVSCTAWARTRAPVTERVTTMRVFVNSWRQSFAAVALAAVLSPASGEVSQTFAAEKEREAPSVKVESHGGKHRAPAAEKEREGPRHELRETPGKERSPEAPGEHHRDRHGDEQRKAHAGEVAQRRAHLLEKAAEIRHKMKTLQPDQDAAARELKGALERIEIQLQELQAKVPGRERVLAHLEELKAAHRRAREAGRGDEAERLAREARELMRTLEHRPADRPEDRPEDQEAQRRLRHLRAAIENLRAAGMPAQAEALAREAERLVHGERPAAPEQPRRPDVARDVPAPSPHLERSVQELRGEVRELRRQMEEIREHLKALAEKR